MNLLEAGKSVAGWLEVMAVLCTALFALTTLWLRSKFISRTELVDILSSNQTQTDKTVDAIYDKMAETNGRVDEILKLLIDRLPRPK